MQTVKLYSIEEGLEMMKAIMADTAKKEAVKTCKCGKEIAKKYTQCYSCFQNDLANEREDYYDMGLGDAPAWYTRRRRSVWSKHLGDR